MGHRCSVFFVDCSRSSWRIMSTSCHDSANARHFSHLLKAILMPSHEICKVHHPQEPNFTKLPRRRFGLKSQSSPLLWVMPAALLHILYSSGVLFRPFRSIW